MIFCQLALGFPCFQILLDLPYKFSEHLSLGFLHGVTLSLCCSRSKPADCEKESEQTESVGQVFILLTQLLRLYAF